MPHYAHVSSISGFHTDLYNIINIQSKFSENSALVLVQAIFACFPIDNCEVNFVYWATGPAGLYQLRTVLSTGKRQSRKVP